MRHAYRRDAAEGPIAEALKALGASVVRVNGKDVPDLVIGFRGQTLLLEVKSPKGMVLHPGKLTEGQERFRREWRGGPVKVARTVPEALEALGLPKGWKIHEQAGDE